MALNSGEGQLCLAGHMLKSAYELKREETIRKNNLMLLKLGLLATGSGSGIGQTSTAPSSEGKGKGSSSGPKSKPTTRKGVGVKRKKGVVRSSRSLRSAAPQRKSRRLAKQDAEITIGQAVKKLANIEAPENLRIYDDIEEAKRRDARYQKLVEAHLQNGVKLPPNATYAHTYMRVRTMSEPKLLRRIKTIERATGQWAVVKMRMFAEVLILEAYDELADEAKAALNRLLLLPKYRAFLDSDQYKSYIRND
eukprot:CAMPEP_0197523628 /NCGR_PEP_ID=MMETSP1318-20131121/8527_1 /TAXON_ID=552666 /ORGANISM="Partenskyella glossopodia, Strain RCC365" /LENGTH=250 /DNA_ID=CAMNT_0043076385 /DNA_START=38 /DNA_END=787 /DNA_ORIENTATION=-